MSNEVDLFTFQEFCARHPWVKLSYLRKLQFQKPAGFSGCVLRLGRKLLISEQAFLQWVVKQQRVDQQG